MSFRNHADEAFFAAGVDQGAAGNFSWVCRA
jgi:hypothetical protein